jgi:peptidoglycan biosynthesis protein MviN/MurJ (putative lipid II flippase)
MLNKNSYKKGVLWMLLFNIIARGISFVLSIILAKTFLPADTDVYLYTWSLISIVLVIISAVNLMAAGPEYIRLCETGDMKGAADLNSALLNIFLTPLLVFSVITLFLPVDTYRLISGFKAEQLVPAMEMLRFSGIWLVLVILNSFLGNVLLSRKYFVGSILGQAMAAGFTLFFILVFKDQWGIKSFFIGQIGGNILCLVFYVYQMRKRIKERFRLFYYKLSKKVVKEMTASVIIGVPTLVTNFILVYLLSRMVTGQLSAYNYGTTLSNLPDVIIISQFISVIGVKFSEISASQQRDVLFGAVRYFGNHLFFFMSGVAVIMSLMSPVIIGFFYGRENLGESTYNTAVLTLVVVSGTLAFKSLDTLHNRVFASLQALSVLMKYTVPLKIANIGLLLLLSWKFGFNGILIQQTAFAFIMMALQLYLFGKYLPPEKVRAYAGQIALLFLGSLMAYGLGRLLIDYVFVHTSVAVQTAMICLLLLLVGILFEKIFKVTMLFDLVLKRVSVFFMNRRIK